MLILISILAATIPMILYLVLIWRFDIYEREPFRLVFQSYLWGAIGAILLALLFSIFLNTGLSFFFPSKKLLSRIDTFYIAPFVEEITKGLFLLILVNSKR